MENRGIADCGDRFTTLAADSLAGSAAQVPDESRTKVGLAASQAGMIIPIAAREARCRFIVSVSSPRCQLRIGGLVSQLTAVGRIPSSRLRPLRDGEITARDRAKDREYTAAGFDPVPVVGSLRILIVLLGGGTAASHARSYQPEQLTPRRGLSSRVIPTGTTPCPGRRLIRHGSGHQRLFRRIDFWPMGGLLAAGISKRGRATVKALPRRPRAVTSSAENHMSARSRSVVVRCQALSGTEESYEGRAGTAPCPGVGEALFERSESQGLP